MANFSRQMNFNFSCGCTNWTPFHITWLNKRGGFDKYSFRLRSTTKLDIQRKEWSRFISKLKLDDTFGYEIGDRGGTSYFVKSFYSYTVVSTWQTEQEHRWLAELFESPEQYYISSSFENGYYQPVYIPIIVTNSQIEVKSKNGFSGRLLSYVIDFTMAYDMSNQNG